MTIESIPVAIIKTYFVETNMGTNHNIRHMGRHGLKPVHVSASIRNILMDSQLGGKKFEACSQHVWAAGKAAGFWRGLLEAGQKPAFLSRSSSGVWGGIT